jgi:hypothetical protein
MMVMSPELSVAVITSGADAACGTETILLPKEVRASTR